MVLPDRGQDRKAELRSEQMACYVAEQVGHEDVTTTNRIYRYVLQRRRRGEIGRRRRLAMRESADIGRSEHLPPRARGR
jgi:integrase